MTKSAVENPRCFKYFLSSSLNAILISIQSYLDCCSSTATFNGTLDTRTLGGAGFASQRTTTTKKVWNLKPYDAIKIAISNPSRSQSFSQPITPPEKYTFIVKDTLPDKRPDGRDEATINYEYDFKVDQGSEDSEEEIEIIIPWSRFQPMYRGKPKKDANKLDTKSIRRFSIMMRRFD